MASIDPSGAQKRADEYNADAASRSASVQKRLESERVTSAFGGPAQFRKQVRDTMRDSRHEGHPMSRADAKDFLTQKLYRAEEKARNDAKPPEPKQPEKTPQIAKAPDNTAFEPRPSQLSDPVQRPRDVWESNLSAPELGPIPAQPTSTGVTVVVTDVFWSEADACLVVAKSDGSFRYIGTTDC